MVEGISSGSTYQYHARNTVSKSLTDDQKETLQSIISNYDVDNMSDDDKKSMFDQIKEAGIGFNDEVKGMLDDAGFTPPEKPEGPPPSDDGKSDKSQLIQDLLGKVDTGEISQDEISSLIESLQKAGQSTTGVFMDQKS
jgi:hypothetical protein